MLLLVDSSAWVEFLRGTGSRTDLRLREALQSGDVATTDAVMLEIVGGAKDIGQRDQLIAMLDGVEYVRQLPRTDVLAAAELHRVCRRQGITVRSWLDCVIAAVAIRSSLALLHADADFSRIAEHSDLVEQTF